MVFAFFILTIVHLSFIHSSDYFQLQGLENNKKITLKKNSYNQIEKPKDFPNFNENFSNDNDTYNSNNELDEKTKLILDKKIYFKKLTIKNISSQNTPSKKEIYFFKNIENCDQKLIKTISVNTNNKIKSKIKKKYKFLPPLPGDMWNNIFHYVFKDVSHEDFFNTYSNLELVSKFFYDTLYPIGFIDFKNRIKAKEVKRFLQKMAKLDYVDSIEYALRQYANPNIAFKKHSFQLVFEGFINTMNYFLLKKFVSPHFTYKDDWSSNIKDLYKSFEYYNNKRFNKENNQQTQHLRCKNNLDLLKENIHPLEYIQKQKYSYDYTISNDYYNHYISYKNKKIKDNVFIYTFPKKTLLQKKYFVTIQVANIEDNAAFEDYWQPYIDNANSIDSLKISFCNENGIIPFIESIPEKLRRKVSTISFAFFDLENPETFNTVKLLPNLKTLLIQRLQNTYFSDEKLFLPSDPITKTLETLYVYEHNCFMLGHNDMLELKNIATILWKDEAGLDDNERNFHINLSNFTKSIKEMYPQIDFFTY